MGHDSMFSTLEARTGRAEVKDLHWTHHHLSLNTEPEDVAQVVEGLLSQHRTLVSTPVPQKIKKVRVSQRGALRTNSMR